MINFLLHLNYTEEFRIMRIKQFLPIFLMLILSSLTVIVQTANAYNSKLHPIITKESINKSNLSTANYLNRELGFKKDLNEEFEGPDKTIGGDITINTRTAQGWIERGSLVEDIPMGLRARTHFYDPVNEIGLTDLREWLITEDHALKRAKGEGEIEFDYSWKDAREYYYKALTSETKEVRNENFAKTFRTLGQVLHLLQDMAVPAHVRNDNHFPPRIFSSGGWDMYEHYCTPGAPLIYEGYPVVEFDQLKPESEEYVSFDDFWDTNIGSATFGKGLAEFTNHNFLSRDTNFDAIRDYHKYLYPLKPTPSDMWWSKDEEITYTDENTGEEITTTVKVEYLKRYAYDNYLGAEFGNPCLTAKSYFDFETEKYGVKAYSLNRSCHQCYAKLLLPRVVGYSAGLLNYFFRGKLDATIIPVEGGAPNERELKITNKSDEDMKDGTLTFLYENKDGIYVELKKQSGVKIDAGKEYEGEFRFNKPQEKVVNYILVFNGTLGNEAPVSDQEKGAVVGKIWLTTLKIVWEESSAIYMYDLSVDTDEDGVPNYLDSDRPDPDPAEVRIPISTTHGPWMPWLPYIANNKIIYVGGTYGECEGIYMYDLSVDTDKDGVPNYLEDPPLNPDPAESLVIGPIVPGVGWIGGVSDKHIFYAPWEEKIPGDEGWYYKIDIYRYDLANKEEEYITSINTGSRVCWNVAVDSGKIVYVQKRPRSEVRVYNISTGEDRAVHAYEGENDYVAQYFPDISGDKVVYVQNPGIENVWRYYGHVDLYDLSTSTLMRLGEYDEENWPYADAQQPPFTYPQIHGNIVAWATGGSDTGESPVGVENPIHIYDLAKGEELPATSRPYSRYPKTYRGIVVWGLIIRSEYPDRWRTTALYLYDTAHPEHGTIEITPGVKEGWRYSSWWRIGY